MNPESTRPDEDDEISAEEVAAASDETPTNTTAPELDGRTKDLTEWDTPPESSGTTAPKVLPEDEGMIAEQLVYEGTDEADRISRQAAADPDFEP